jgi:sulfotransferase
MKIHFITGLPRAGSTLLAAILRQNKCMSAAMTSPVSDVFASALHVMSLSETSLFLSNVQRANILKGIVHNYYADCPPETTIFDTSRMWSAHTALIARLFPSARLICCVRNPAWIVDSIERLVRCNSLLTAKMFGPDVGNVYARAEVLMKNGVLGASLQALRQAWYSEEASKLIAIQYDSLAQRPGETLRKLYHLIGEAQFPHTFDNLEYDESDFDARLNMPGLHRVSKRVELRKRDTILPPDLFRQFDDSFWSAPENNPRGVAIL